MRAWRPGGFTLVEVLLALGLLALLSLLAYRGLDGMLRTRDQVRAYNERWREIALFFERLGQDLGQALGKPLGLAAGGSAAWLQGFSLPQERPGQPLLMFTRRQLGSALELPVGYRQSGDRVEWLQWGAGAMQPAQVEVVLEGVQALRLFYLDGDGAWAGNWPPATGATRLPRAVAVDLTPRGGQPLSRVFALP